MALELGVRADSTDERGHVSGFAITDRLIFAALISPGAHPLAMVLASSNARRFVPLATPTASGVRDLLAVGDALWACGEHGLFAVSRDQGRTWTTLDLGTRGGLFGMALAPDGAIWVVGDGGFAARLHGERPEVVELGTRARLLKIYAVNGALVALGADGVIRRWTSDELTPAVTAISPGTTGALTALVVTARHTWIVVGDAGFVARSPDGQWYSRVTIAARVDLEGLVQTRDGTLVVVGERGHILASSDDGRTWMAIASPTSAHLWCVRRFGAGVLIGGDRGLILALAPAGEPTWDERIDVFAGERSLDDVFAEGPVGFIARGLAAVLGAPAGARDDATTTEHARASAFAEIYGVPIPSEARNFFQLVRGHDRVTSFAELRLDRELPDVAAANLFEQLVCHDQQAYLGSDLASAFCGVFGIGSQGNGDTYHLEIYPWDGPRQVLHFDRGTATFSGVIADSLDALVYLTSLVKVGDIHAISRETFARGMRALHGKVSPTWHFSLDDKAPAFVRLEPKRCDSEFFFYRSRWICALLKHDGVADLDHVRELFQPNFNQVIPDEQLPARYEACEKYIPTALYAMWRAYLFDEPELGRYLELGRAHASRLVRDAAALVGELRGGRRQLGTIADVPTWLAAFRALDLDPRRAVARAAEATARAAIAAAHKQLVVAELARTPTAGWPELAWRWLEDGVAQRALLEHVDASAGRAQLQIEDLDALDEVADEERVVSLGRLARELDPVLEAVLVGSLVRADRLDGVLLRPVLEVAPEIEDLPDNRDLDERDDDDDDDDGDDGDGDGDDAVGAGLDALYAAVRQTVHAGRGHVIDDDDDDHDAWRRSSDAPAPLGREAIDRALGRLYHGVEPAQHFVAPVLYELGGRDPLHQIVAYLRADPRPHFHVVTYGFSEQFGDGAAPDATSGYGFELTLRLARTSTQTDVPRWAIRLLQDLGRAVFEGGDRFAAGDARALPSPLGDPPLVAAVGFVDDPELGAIGSPLGHARFLQVVGLTHDEHHAMLAGQRHAILALLGAVDPYLVTDPRRLSVLADWARAQDLARKIGEEGSSEVVTVVDALAVVHDADRVRLVVSALAAEVLPHAMRGRLAHGRSATLRNGGRSVTFERGEVHGYQVDDRATTLVVQVTAELAHEIEAALLVPHVGVVRFATWSRLEIEVTPTFLRDDTGEVIGVRGFADPAAATAAIEAQRSQEAGEVEVEAEADVDVDAAEVEAVAEVEAASSELEPPPQVVAALAMTARALRLAPHDADTQYAHAMLMIDAERAGTGGTVVDLLPRFTSGVRIAVAVRLGALAHRRFGDAVDAVVGAVDPVADVASELYAQLGAAILRHVPTKMAGLIGRLPDDIELLCDLASQAIEVDQRAHALALYDRVLALPMPLVGDVDGRAIYLMALHDACLQAHAARAFDVAVRLADRAQPVAHENPYLYHAAACAYAAVGELTRALDQIKLAIAHDYEHVEQLERDPELGALRGSSELAAVFAAWHAGQART